MKSGLGCAHRVVKCQSAGSRRSGVALLDIVLMVILAAPLSALPATAAEFRFVKIVDLVPKSAVAKLSGAKASLLVKPKGPDKLRIVLSGLGVGGTKQNQELATVVKRKTLSLDSSILVDVAQDRTIYEMRRRRGVGPLSKKEVDLFDYTRFGDSGATTTQPYVEYKVVDFLSMFLVAAKYVHDKKSKPVDLSMLYKRSVTRVQLFRTKKTKLGVMVKVVSPDNPAGGFTYVISRTSAGEYYPSYIGVNSEKEGYVELEGQPR